ncbi:hypothetical protein BDK51DRAFT_29966 [Blyttiomyces helicus]|uniref:Uncharacterized protein n=1 Tax=Blyttiomyces helicus TaxID=388810 RepID=A0A4P9WLH3_9FUNG|nr:hypothetical protein BDK51DRAFT_29966 [Blyttiomyces helicus]|eukprot:RKO93724.1 hypothetical protein BDK51DRAFT_29966 [Blyttiomyces helicus]
MVFFLTHFWVETFRQLYHNIATRSDLRLDGFPMTSAKYFKLGGVACKAVGKLVDVMSKAVGIGSETQKNVALPFCSDAYSQRETWRKQSGTKVQTKNQAERRPLNKQEKTCIWHNNQEHFCNLSTPITTATTTVTEATTAITEATTIARSKVEAAVTNLSLNHVCRSLTPALGYLAEKNHKQAQQLEAIVASLGLNAEDATGVALAGITTLHITNASVPTPPA